MKWEYKIVEPDESIEVLEDAIEHLNRHGREGWELVQVIEGNSFFKRPVQPPREISQMEQLGG